MLTSKALCLPKFAPTFTTLLILRAVVQWESTKSSLSSQDRGGLSAVTSTGSGGRIPLLLGYRPDLELFVLWDADLYVDFAYSRNVQVKPETVYEGFAQGIGRQVRNLRIGEKEIVIVADRRHLAEALIHRQHETLKRLLRGAI